MISKKEEVVIIGGGVFGFSVAYHLVNIQADPYRCSRGHNRASGRACF